MEEAIWAVGLEVMETFISRCQNKVAQYIAMRLIIDLFLEAKQRPGSRVSKRWWDQEGLYFAGWRDEDEEDGEGERGDMEGGRRR